MLEENRGPWSKKSLKTADIMQTASPTVLPIGLHECMQDAGRHSQLQRIRVLCLSSAFSRSMKLKSDKIHQLIISQSENCIRSNNPLNEVVYKLRP